MPPRPTSESQTLRVQVMRVIRYDEDDGFAIMFCQGTDGKTHKVLGPYHEDPAGQEIVAHGAVEHDETYGRQFRAAYIEPARFNDPDRIKGYLASLGIAGIAEVIAGHIVDRFGTAAFDVIDRNPDDLLAVPRMPAKAVEFLHRNWRGLDANRELVLFLLGLGIPSKKIPDIRKSLGFDAESKIRSDPYILCRRINGFGFEKADAIARRFGVDEDSPVRKRAMIESILQTGISDGQCGRPLDEAMTEAAERLRLPEDEVLTFTEDLIDAGYLGCEKIDDVDILYLPWVLEKERGIARMLLGMTGKEPSWDPLDAGWEIDNHKGLPLGAEQAEAVRTILSERLSVMTGGPGVGKTTTLKTALDILADNGVNIALCAPTGMAAKRMTEATGRQATTIHTFLEVDGEDGGFKRHANNPLYADLVVADEFSMADINLASSLIEAIGPRTSFLIVGDVDQLPSVGPGRVLNDIISSETVPVSRLTEVFRQKANSRIITAAHAINRGEMPPKRPTDVDPGELDFLHLETESEQGVQDKILRLVTERLSGHPLLQRTFEREGKTFDPIRDAMVVAAQKSGDAGVNALNVKLRAALNPLPAKGSPDRFDIGAGDGEATVSFGIGDQVMNTVNKHDRGIVNGDIGFVREIAPDGKAMLIEFDRGSIVIPRREARDIQLAYAMTVHKSQGSEAPVLIMPVTKEFKFMQQRNLVYTGLTRGKNLAIILGTKDALEMAVENVKNHRRWSFTGEALRRSGQRIEDTNDFAF